MFLEPSWTVLRACILVCVAPESIQPLSIAVLLQLAALVFPRYYSPRLMMLPQQKCQHAGGESAFGAGRIYCHDAGDRLHGNVPSTESEHSSSNPNYHISIQVYARRIPKIS